jgi:hypothetical protein
MGLSISCIDTLNHDKTSKALERTLVTLGDKVSKVYWFSDNDYSGNAVVDWVKIEEMSKIPDDYNRVTLELIPQTVVEDFNIIVQYDGFAVNTQAWTDEFLEYDYIGAVWSWHHDRFGSENQVGNGGFSLRSKKLYQALLDFKMMEKPQEQEDDMICRVYRKELEANYGIRYSPNHLADRFSIEHNLSSPWCGKSLGFHGNHGVASHYGVSL